MQLEGHLGTETCLSKVREHFLWFGLEGDVGRFCQSCLACAKMKSKNHARLGPLGNVRPGYKLKRIAVDILCGLLKSDSGHGHHRLFSQSG